MYRFSTRIASCAFHKTVWEDAGFVCVDREEVSEQSIDVLILAQDDREKLEHAIKIMRPKVFFVVGRYELSPEIAHLYADHHWRFHDSPLTIGTFLEVPLPEPIWEAYADQQEKAIADTVYRHLLHDIFRETAEWCGHMSSVVRPM